jgi:hypothetical protein
MAFEGFEVRKCANGAKNSRGWSRVVVLEQACAVHETSGGARCTSTAYVFSKVGESDDLCDVVNWMADKVLND